jgi:hypothetical protein
MADTVTADPMPVMISHVVGGVTISVATPLMGGMVATKKPVERVVESGCH